MSQVCAVLRRRVLQCTENQRRCTVCSSTVSRAMISSARTPSFKSVPCFVEEFHRVRKPAPLHRFLVHGQSSDDKQHPYTKSQSSNDKQRPYAKSQICAVLRRRVPPCTETSATAPFSRPWASGYNRHRKFLLNVETLGNKQRETFITECSADKERFEKVIKRNKILNFATAAPKQKIYVAGKSLAIRMQRDLFGQLFSLSLEQTLNIDKVLAYPLTPVPLALCHIDGTICKTDKSVLLKILEKEIDSNPPERCDVIVYDGFFIMHSIRDVPSSFGNISKKLMQVFTANSADTVIIAFDRYIFPSIKDNEHSLRRRVKGQRFQINGPDQIRPSNFADALKNIYFKETLVDLIIDDWANDYMAPFIGSKTILVNYLQCHQYKVCQGKVQRTSESSLACPGHEEADTKIVFHVCHLTSDAHVTIRCSDTDIMIIMLANMNFIQTDLQISMHVGAGNNQKFINVTKLSQTLGLDLCSALPAFHAITGCDLNSAFYRKGKKKPFQILLKSPTYIQALCDISNIPNSNVDELFATLEEYVCRLYAFTGVNDINVARVMTFTKSYGNNDNCNPLNLNKKNRWFVVPAL
ncbi:hypothetical protein EVAR_93318_1 [Eumeta japonica]|uniref:Uncharacterized protein n=1 Tax=Eumeta variegata TaxID=151549 RepID=A0A4C1UST1_EUMVA|nr:hypothetical protein EVAR_93318_1 [Eumeta japonica]